MSRIGKKPIPIPKGVKIDVKPGDATVAKGADQMISATLSGFDAADAASYDARLVAALSAEPSSAEAIAIQWQNSPVGPLLLGATDSHLVLLEFSDPTQLEAQLTRLRKHFARPLACVLEGEQGLVQPHALRALPALDAVAHLLDAGFVRDEVAARGDEWSIELELL